MATTKRLLLALLGLTALYSGTSYSYNDTSNLIYKESRKTAPGNSNWNEVEATVLDRNLHDSLLKSILPSPGMVNTSHFVPQPVYISLTTMASRMDSIDATITNLLQARIVPTMIYLFISEEPYLMDTGVKVIPLDLLCFVAAGYLRIIYTQNIGPHRKLLPALKRHWGEDVFIVTMDDDLELDQSHVILYQLLKYYVKGGGDSIVSLRARRIGFCREKPHRSSNYDTWTVNFKYGHKEMLILPTGNGGVLYKPAFFNDAVFHKGLRRLTMTADDVTFRLTTLFMQIPVLLGCIPLRAKGLIVRECEYDEFDKEYDQQYGTASTAYYYKTMNEVTKKLVLEHKKATQIASQTVSIGLQHSNVSTSRRLREGGEISEYKKCWEGQKCGEREASDDDSVDWVDSAENNSRRKLVKFRVKRTPKSVSNNSDLFSYNKVGGNTEAWESSLKVLKSLHVFDFDLLAGKYLGEREEHCMDTGLTYREAANCAVYNCIRNGTSWVVTYKSGNPDPPADVGDIYLGLASTKRNQHANYVNLVPSL